MDMFEVYEMKYVYQEFKTETVNQWSKKLLIQGEDYTDVEDLVDTTGYQPLKDQIADAKAAGEQYNKVMAQRYPHQGDEEPIEPLPYSTTELDVIDMLRRIKPVERKSQSEAQSENKPTAAAAAEATPEQSSGGDAPS